MQVLPVCTTMRHVHRACQVVCILLVGMPANKREKKAANPALIIDYIHTYSNMLVYIQQYKLYLNCYLMGCKDLDK